MWNLKRSGYLAALIALIVALVIGVPALLHRAPPNHPAADPAPVAEADDPAGDDDAADETDGTTDENGSEADEPDSDPFVLPPAPRPAPPFGPRPPWRPPHQTPTNPPVDPTSPPVDPTTPPVDPTDPPTDPTDPPTDPTDPPVDPTDPPVDPEPTGPLTVISLTFDDGSSSQLAAAQVLDEHGVDGTFYVNSGTIGLGGYLTLADLQGLSGAGHEIGGHSVTHADLVGLPDDEVRRQVCDDRSQLLAWGFGVRSFAYPFASTDSSVEAAVAGCGYNSGRMLGDIRSRFGCPDCAVAETIPPPAPYYTKALDQFDQNWTLQDLQDAVVNAETTGGWLQYTFHDVCTSACGELSVSVSMLDQFLDWLAARATTKNTVVRTVGDVVGGPVQPAVSGPAVPPPSGGNGIVNPGLEQIGPNGVPSCWWQAPYGSNTPSFGLTTGHTGAVASRIVMSGYSSGDAKLLPVFDLGSCAPSVMPGESYSLRAWYTSTVVTQFAVYLRTNSGGWTYWTSSPWFAATSVFTEAEWSTPPIPVGYNGISFGLNIFNNGELVTDDYAIYNTVGAPPVAPPPPAPIAPPTEESTLDGLTDGTAPGDGTTEEQPPAEQPPSDQPPTEQPPTEQPPTEQPPAEQPPAEQPPAEQPPTGGPAEPPAQQPPAPPPTDPPAPESDPGLLGTLGGLLSGP